MRRSAVEGNFTCCATMPSLIRILLFRTAQLDCPMQTGAGALPRGFSALGPFLRDPAGASQFHSAQSSLLPLTSFPLGWLVVMVGYPVTVCLIVYVLPKRAHRLLNCNCSIVATQTAKNTQSLGGSNFIFIINIERGHIKAESLWPCGIVGTAAA